MSEVFERFAKLALRELDATTVVVARAEDPEPTALVVLSAPLRDGRRIDVTFDHAVDDRDAVLRRLKMLIDAFESALSEPKEERRKQPAFSLQEELRALAARAQADDARVIDAHSPVTWASAHGFAAPEALRKAVAILEMSRRELIDEIRDELGDAPSDEPPDGDGKLAEKPAEKPENPRDSGSEKLALRAVAAVRKLPEIASLRRGGHLAHVVREESFGFLARSFAGIYVIVVVFDHAFDEIRAERAVRDSLPRIEQLVLALPPMDPQPLGGVVAMRKRRR